MRKKIDQRIRTLIENCNKLKQRGLFVIIGDKGRDQVANLHYIVSKVGTYRPSVLWCYKKELYLSSHKRKRMKQIKKMAQRGLIDPEKEDPFALFVASTQIRYCYYNETHTILGNTFGMCVLQDFEGLTPNLLARTIETVQGGGLVVMLLSNLQSLSQLYNLTMDVHSRFRTDAHQNITARFNERMVLSLSQNPHCILMDDELNILPTSTKIKHIQAAKLDSEGNLLDNVNTALDKELVKTKEALRSTQPVGILIDLTVTLDQAKSLITLIDSLTDKTLNNTIAMTASRGRGKSACLGLSIAGAIALGYSNIFVTSPSPENLGTLYQFIFKGLDALGFKEHIDYDIQESTNPRYGKAIVRVNIYKHHRQTVQYILPDHYNKLSQAELVVIDEAASIPLTVVKNLLGPYLVFMCSTINGYEGTGRSLSLKLIQQLRQNTLGSNKVQGSGLGQSIYQDKKISGRSLRETELQQPIRYATNDPIESWLNELLCLDAANHIPSLPPKLPHPDECELYYVERDTLFSYHKASELFLQRLMSLYISSHYKNTPNDLMLMSDAPAHQVYVLLAPVEETQNALPEILCVIQVALEGSISKNIAMQAVAQGQLPQGDLIPWTIGQQYQDPNFPKLSGCRVVRIATHPDLSRAGYGSRAINQLKLYFQGDIIGLDSLSLNQNDLENGNLQTTNNAAKSKEGNNENNYEQLQSEIMQPKSKLPPLLINLEERRPEILQYVGVSYGLTQQLYNFWNKSNFQPLYLRQTPNETTGERTMIMVSPLKSSELEGGTGWLDPFVNDFKGRYKSLLGSAFRQMEPSLALQIINPQLEFSEDQIKEVQNQGNVILKQDGSVMNSYDVKRLTVLTIFFAANSTCELLITRQFKRFCGIVFHAYANNTVDHHLILDLIPSLAHTFFAGKLPGNLSYTQSAILLNLGLQHRSLDEICEYLDLPSSQVLALFNKMVRRFSTIIKNLEFNQAKQHATSNNTISNNNLENGILPIQKNQLQNLAEQQGNEQSQPKLVQDKSMEQEQIFNKNDNEQSVVKKHSQNDKVQNKSVTKIDIDDLQLYAIKAQDEDIQNATKNIDLNQNQNLSIGRSIQNNVIQQNNKNDQQNQKQHKSKKRKDSQDKQKFKKKQK